MRQCHPDLVGETEGSAFATVLNDIYEVGNALCLLQQAACSLLHLLCLQNPT